MKKFCKINEILSSPKRVQKFSSYLLFSDHKTLEAKKEDISKVVKFQKITNLKRGNIGKKIKEPKFNECIKLNKQIEELKKKKEDLNKEEMCRIFDEYKKHNFFEKNNVSKNTLLNCLIGEDNLMYELYQQNKKEKKWMKYFQIVDFIK